MKKNFLKLVIIGLCFVNITAFAQETTPLELDLATALKVKSSVERLSMIKIVEKILRDSIENKYFIE